MSTTSTLIPTPDIVVSTESLSPDIVVSTESPSPDIAVGTESPSPDIAVGIESQSSLGAGIGGGVAVVLLLLVAVTLLLVWRRKLTSKAVLQPAVADCGMPQLDNPVYDGKCRNDCP